MGGCLMGVYFTGVHLTLTSLASFRRSLTFVPDGLIEDMAALLELQWHQVVLAHSLATCSAIVRGYQESIQLSGAYATRQTS
jgi:hypothetical protein